MKQIKKWSDFPKGLRVFVVVMNVFLFLVIVLSIISGDDGTTSDPVKNSIYDGSVRQVIEYLNNHLKDPKSLEVISWGRVQKYDDGTYGVNVRYRARNSFGGYVIERKFFTFDKVGNIISIEN